MKKQTFIFGVTLLGILVACCVLVAPRMTHADAPHSFTVDSTADSSDASAGDSNCDDGSGACTLRAAIQESNALGGASTINFNISGSGVHIITPASDLPQITSALTIDGTTQPGASCGTLVPASLPASSNTPHTLKIQINATATSNGLSVQGNNSVIKGLAINDAGNSQIDVGSDDTTIECNYLGTTAGGVAVSNSGYPNGINSDSGSGVLIDNNLIANGSNGIYNSWGDNATVSNNLIGTSINGKTSVNNSGTGIIFEGSYDSTISHNIINGNDTGGIEVMSGEGDTIHDNFVGLGIDGAHLGNGGAGISVFGSEHTKVGGGGANERNYISANSGDGVHIYSDCHVGDAVDTTVFGNYIGTNINGEVATGYGNGAAGVEVNEFLDSCGSVYQNQIGGDGNGESNVIAGNHNQGVLIHQDNLHDVFSISVLGNSIFGNGGLGIDLASDSANDGVSDTALGPNPINNLPLTYPATNGNNFINRPTINSSNSDGSKITVNYNLVANPVQDSGGISLNPGDLVGYRLDFYLNDKQTDGAYSGYAQGQTHLGFFIVDGSETNAIHEFTTSASLDGKYITATTTVLWKVIPDGNSVPCDDRVGNGPPYYSSSINCPQ